ncbi:MAG: hypothetical protein AB8G23_17485 [Myxococcota bacterium]
MTEKVSGADSEPDAAHDDPPRLLWPNLGAEEGGDEAAVAQHVSARQAAKLWALLFARQDEICWPNIHKKSADGIPREPIPSVETRRQRCESLWPLHLGNPPDAAAFAWLAEGGVHAWLKTEMAEAKAKHLSGQALLGPGSACVRSLGDKGNTAKLSDELGLTPRTLAPLIQVLSPEDCLEPDQVIARLSADVEAWPAWTGGRFTLKPRWGTSGRGRVAGVGSLETRAIRGALPRLAERGGALLEPWCARESDLSVSVHIPAPEAEEKLPTLLGSLSMLTSASGLYRGHCGELDHRGRVFSGHREDETLRGDAAILAGRAQQTGFFGPCGIDAFTYREDDRTRLRSIVEFNPRMTMGIVTIGLIRRALPLARQKLDLSPGDRRAFLMTTFDEADEASRDAIVTLREGLGENTLILDLRAPSDSSLAASQDGLAHDGAPATEGLRPLLFFAPDLESLRGAYQEAIGC